MSRLIDIDPQIQPKPEPEGYEYYTFNPLPALEVHDIEATSEKSIQDDTSDDHLWQLHISNNILAKL